MIDDSNDQKQIQRNLRTPITEAGAAISVACDFYVYMLQKLQEVELPSDIPEEFKNPEEHFFSEVFKNAFENPQTSGEKEEEKLRLLLDEENSETMTVFGLLKAIEIVVAYSVQAMKAAKNNEVSLAWTYAVDATYWSSLIFSDLMEKKYGESPAKRLAKKRHAENYAMCSDAIKYWREKIDPNLSAAKAAERLLQFVPLSHKKLAELISAEKKKRY